MHRSFTSVYQIVFVDWVRPDPLRKLTTFSLPVPGELKGRKRCISTRTPKITRILTWYQAKRANFDEVQFFKHIPKLIIIGTHNLHTLKHNTLIKELLLMQVYEFNIHLNCITGSDKNYASHCSELSQLHQQPVDAVLRPTFIRKLCYKLQSIVTFTFIQNFDQNFVLFTEWCHVDRQCDT